MASYPNSAHRTLSDSHRRMLEEGSAIMADVIAERGVYTVTRGRDLPKGFSKRQRARGGGILFIAHRPDGSTGYSFRPDATDPKRPGHKYEQPCKSLGSPGNVLDVHPSVRHLIDDTSVPVVFVEGVKKADALISAARKAGEALLVVAISGVWNWLSDGEPIADMLAIPVEGRKVTVMFDSDMLRNPSVQDAAGRLAEHLGGRGADVYVAYLADQADGSKTGADDFLVAGGTLAELKMLARRYDPADFVRVRLSRDEKLRAGLGDLERRWWAEEWKGRGGHSERDVYLKLIEAAPSSGKVHADGIRVRVSWGALQVAAKVSRQTLAKALKRLEERGLLYRDNEGRKADKTGAFVLRAKVDQYRERDAKQEKATNLLQVSTRGGLPLRASRLRWSRPAWRPRRGFVSGTRKVRESKPGKPRERIERLGKIRGAVVDALEVAGGTLTLQELCEVLHRKRARDVRRRTLPMLEDAGIIETVDDVIALAADWTARLDEARAAGGEMEADEQAEADRKRKSRAYHQRNAEAKSRPSAEGVAAIKRSHEKRAEHIAEHDEQAAAARAAEIKAKSFAKRYVHDRLRALGRIRLGLLQDILRDEGGMPAYAEPAAKSLGCTIERLPEYGNEPFVYAPREWAS